jgi:two-component system, LuxR family, sensor kinase FixL
MKTMSALKEYVAFVRTHRLEEFTTLELETARAMNIPLLRFFTSLSEEKLREMTRVSLFGFLSSLEDGTAHERAIESIKRWETDQLPGIRKEDVHPSDLVLVYAAQKISFLKFIPEFTDDSAVALSIFLEIESYYTHIQDMAIQRMFHMHEESEQKLKEADAHYRDLFESATDLIQVVDIEGTILLVNPSWLETLEYTYEEVIGKHLSNFIAPEIWPYFREQREMLIRNGQIENLETSFISKSGRRIIAEGNISCRKEGDTVIGTRAIFRNITGRRANEEKLRYYTSELKESEQQIQDIFQNAPDAVIVIDENSRIIHWNPKAEVIFGWKSSEVMGTYLQDTIIPEQHREAHTRGMNHYMATGETAVMNRTIEITALKKDGKEFYISLSISNSFRKAHPVFISFIRDITSQKMNELELTKKTRELERSNKELDQYASLASHDLKEPLRKITTFSNRLVSKYAPLLGDDGRSYLQKIDDAAMRMTSLISNLLTYSRIMPVKESYVKTDLNVLITTVLADLEISIEEKKAVIQVEKLPEIEVHPGQFKQLFQNLISNSLKFSREGEAPWIEIKSHLLPDNRAELLVSDNGIGFESHYSEKIFVMFQRLHSRSEYEGTGIGLALCKKIVESHNGTITARSEKGTGTTFIIRIPLRQGIS